VRGQIAYLVWLLLQTYLERVMSCALCTSANQVEFPTEIAFHFSGRENLDKPHVMAFPKVLLCLDCGFFQSTLPETELRVLKERITPSTAA
jgi:hypothetical protein